MANDLTIRRSAPIAEAGEEHSQGFLTGTTGFPNQEELPLHDLLGALKRHWLVIVVVAAIVTLLGGAVIGSLQTLYKATAELMLDPRRGQVIDLQSVVSNLATGQQLDASTVRSEVAILQSSSLAQNITKQLNLTQLPEFNPALRPLTLSQRLKSSVMQLGPVRGFREKIAHLTTAPPAEQQEASAENKSDLTKEQSEILQAAAILSSRVAIVNDGKSYIIDIVVTTTNPSLSARIANAYAATYISDQLQAKVDASQRGNALVADRIGELSDRLRAADQAVVAFRQAHNLVQGTVGTINTQQLTEINNQLSIARSDLAEKQSRLREIQSVLAGGNPASSASAVLQSPAIQALRDRQTELERQKADLLSRFGERYPLVATNRAQLQSVQQRLTDEINRTVASVRGDANTASSKVASLVTSLNQLQQQSSIDDKTSVQLSELQRQAAADRVVYEAFLARSKQTAEELNLQQADAKIISKADPPLGPFFPNRTLFLVFTIIAGLGCGGVVAILVERTDSGFRTARQVESNTGIPALGLVPELGWTGRRRLKGGHVPPSLDEALRTLRTGIRFSSMDGPSQLVLVTSALAGEGKSYFTVMFARSLSRAGKKVLVVDCDLRRPAIAALVGAPDSGGLLAALRNEPADTILFQEESSGVTFITVPRGLVHPPEILESEQMRMFLQAQRKLYDVIILDAPPMLPVSDALVLSDYADTALFVVRWGKTKRYLASAAVRSLLMRGCNVAGVVLNRVHLKRYASYKDSTALSLPSVTPYFPYK